jgi:pimeloyl-ACP methyl ester carboxylesterase
LTLELAAREPDRVTRTVLLDPAIRLRPDNALRSPSRPARPLPARARRAARGRHGAGRTVVLWDAFAETADAVAG